LTSEEDVFFFGCFDGSTGIEFGPFVADVACFSAGNIEKGDCGPLVGAAWGIMGIRRAFFTPGNLRTVKFKRKTKGEIIGIKKSRAYYI